MKRRSAVLLVCVLLASACCFSQDANRRDGNWWRTQDKVSTYSYLTGLLDGMDLGRMLATSDNRQCLDDVTGNYARLTNKFLSNVTVGQISDGLDEFYKDFRNRRIVTSSAVWIVLNEIVGTPKQQIDKLTESFRRSASLN